jgi:hypothetical protein
VSGDPSTGEEWAALLQRALLGAVMSGDLDAMDIRLLGHVARSFAEKVAAERATALPSFTCPVCDRTSYNPPDVENHYCGHCHV